MPFPAKPLSPEQRRRVCALLAVGATRRMAVKFAACRMLDLVAELKRDPAFKRQVQEHELQPEIEVLRSLNEAARDSKQWRAATWYLERLYPRRYAARKADTLQPAELGAEVDRFVQLLDAAFPGHKQLRRLLRRLRHKRP